MEVTTQKNNVDQIDFFVQESKTTLNSVQRFVPEKPNSAKSSTNSKEIDLSLKLSLDGSYGQNVEEMPLTRSSSIAGEITLGTVANGAQGGSSVPSLDRSCSLPVEAEKALVRFGDLQTMRRVETGKILLQEKLRAAAERKKYFQFSSASARETASALKGPAISPAIDKLKTLANPSGNSKHEDKLASASYNMPYKGPRGLAEVGASSHFLASAKPDNDLMVSPITKFKEMPPRPADTKLENPSKKLRRGNPCSLKGDDMDILRQMPSVATTGDGPGGRRIEGFLYKYRSGQICIVCVCHGSFLSPAEFVMHAGGNKDVANPMRHITVCANSF